MIASVHIADVGPRSALAVLRKRPRPASIPGLRHAEVATAAPLSSSVRPPLQPGRAALLAFWDDEEALDRFLDEHPLAEKLAGGWQQRLDPVRLWGGWPGVPDDLPHDRPPVHDGPAAVLTLGRLRWSQLPRFVRTSARAEGAAIGAPGLTWATGLARPPFVATLSLWESTEALSRYAYGRRDPAHADAIRADADEPFHRRSAFIRFRPLSSRGSLGGRNPLAEPWPAST